MEKQESKPEISPEGKILVRDFMEFCINILVYNKK